MKAKCNLTVIICCYNSASRIRPTLEHLSKQKQKNGLIFEVLLVDNNSKDNTSEIASEIWKSFNKKINLTVVSEIEIGLSHARKKGIKSSNGDLLVFCDDDNWLEENYLQIAFDFMNENPKVGVLGGNSTAISSVEFPNWFSTYQEYYAVGVQNIESSIINNRGYVWGAGMVVRRNDLLNIFDSGFVSLLTDRNGNDLSSGGDSEICSWFLIIGKDLYYNEDLIFKHFIEPSRLSKEYFERLKKGMSLSRNVLIEYNIVINYINKKNKLNFFKIISILKNLFLERNWVNILIFLETLTITQFVFHKRTNKILKSRKLFIEKTK